MLRWRKKIRLVSYIAFDIFSIWLALSIVRYPFLHFFSDSAISLSSLEALGLFSLIAFAYVGLFFTMDVYEDTIRTAGRLSSRIIIKMFIGYLLGSFLIGFILLNTGTDINLIYFSLLFVIILAAQSLSRAIVRAIEFSKDEISDSMRNILIVGSSPTGDRYLQEIRDYDYLNINVVGYVCVDDTDHIDSLSQLGTIDNLEQIVSHHVVDELAVVRPLSSNPDLKGQLNLCQSMGITITMVLELQNTDVSKAHVSMVGSIPVLKFHMVSLNENQLLIKRFMDIIGATIGMVIFGLSYLIVAPLILIESPGPILFKQDRVGKNGRVFKFLKYRSMVADAEAKKAMLMEHNEMKGHMFKMKDDPRVTRVGAFIRKTSIDEIPQFYNVLKGDMSLVGTRPPTVKEVEAYETSHRCRLSITPGITGMWQVSGRSDIQDFEEVVRLDVEYISNWSIWLDIKILFKTLYVVLVRRGSK